MSETRRYMIALFTGLVVTSLSALVWGGHSRSLGSPWAGPVTYGIFSARGESYDDTRRRYERSAAGIAAAPNKLDMRAYVTIEKERARTFATLQHAGHIYLACLLGGILVALPCVLARTRTWVGTSCLVAGCAVAAAGLWAFHTNVHEALVIFGGYEPKGLVLSLTGLSQVRLALWGAVAFFAIVVGAGRRGNTPATRSGRGKAAPRAPGHAG